MIPAYILSPVRDVRCHSVLTVLVWNAFLTLDDEAEHIWPMRNEKLFKWVYFFLRYGVILAHTAHNILIEPLADGRNPPVFCDMWHAYIIAFTQVLQTLLELILASRIYALYNRSRKIAFLLIILILAEAGSAVRTVCLWSGTEFFGACLLILPPEGAKVQTLIGFIVHCTFIGLTLFKYFFALRLGYSRSPLVSLVVRDGTTAYATVIFILASVTVLCSLDNNRGIAIVFWTMAIMSIMGCRLVLSMERLARKMLLDPSQPIFTSKISVPVPGSADLQTDFPSQRLFGVEPN